MLFWLLDPDGHRHLLCGWQVVPVPGCRDIDVQLVGAFLQSLLDGDVPVLWVDLEILFELLLFDASKLVCQIALCIANSEILCRLDGLFFLSKL